jgi:hypothetical protein
MGAAVVAHKRAALVRKRAGDLEGAKEELRQAKAFERRLEEAEEAEAMGLQPLDMLMRAGHTPAGGGHREAPGGDTPRRPLAPGELHAMMVEVGQADDGAVPDVDSDDEKDPEILAALREMGWQDDRAERAAAGGPPRGGGERRREEAGERLEGLAGRSQDVVARREALTQEALGHKREALARKSGVDIEGAKAALARAKLVEQQLERAEEQEAAGGGALERLQARGGAPGRGGPGGGLDLAQVARLLEGGDEEVAVTEEDEQDPDILAALRDMGWQEPPPAPPQRSTENDLTPARRAQRGGPAGASGRASPEQLLQQAATLKRQALGLRRQGKMEEWRAALQEAQALEQEAQQAKTQAGVREREGGPGGGAARRGAGAVAGEDESDVEETEEDETDPALLAALHAMGWQDDPPPAPSGPPGATWQPAGPRESMPQGPTPVSAAPLLADLFSSPFDPPSPSPGSSIQARGGPAGGSHAGGSEGRQSAPAAGSSASKREGAAAGLSGRSGAGPQLDNRRLAGEAAAVAETPPPYYWPDSTPSVAPSPPSPPAPIPVRPGLSTGVTDGAGVSALEEQIRAGKQAAVRLKREGRLEEARAALMQAKRKERELETRSGGGQGIEATQSTGGTGGAAGDQAAPGREAVAAAGIEETEEDEVAVKDAFDPQMVAALKGLGWTDEQIRGSMGGGVGKAETGPRRASAAPVGGNGGNGTGGRGSPQEMPGAGDQSGIRGRLKERIRGAKRKVVELKRAGRQQEALALFKEVKLLEKQLG